MDKSAETGGGMRSRILKAVITLSAASAQSGPHSTLDLEVNAAPLFPPGLLHAHVATAVLFRLWDVRALQKAQLVPAVRWMRPT